MYNATSLIIEDRPFFASLVKRMLDGNRANIKDITRDDIVTLWADELVSDREMAEVYGVSTSDIRKIRCKYRVTHAECVRRYSERALSVLGSLGASIMKI